MQASLTAAAAVGCTQNFQVLNGHRQLGFDRAYMWKCRATLGLAGWCVELISKQRPRAATKTRRN